jgi:hypothetical protein
MCSLEREHGGQRGLVSPSPLGPDH